MYNMDLNISNYSTEELLNLLKLPKKYTDDDLMNKKEMIMNIKGKVEDNVYQFFLKAYQIALELYRNRDDSYNGDLKDFATSNNFNERFNEVFVENYKNSQEDDSFDKWLQRYKNLSESEKKNLLERFKRERKYVNSSSLGYNMKYGRDAGFGALKNSDRRVIYLNNELKKDVKAKRGDYKTIDELTKHRDESFRQHFKPELHDKRQKEIEEQENLNKLAHETQREKYRSQLNRNYEKIQKSFLGIR